MSWLSRLFQMNKQAAFGEADAVSFGVTNINSLQNMINQILSEPPLDQSRKYWFDALANDPGMNYPKVKDL